MQSADMYMEETRKDQQAHSLKTNPITFSCFLAVFFLCPVCLGRGKLISHGNLAYSSVEHFSRPYSQWCGKYIPWPCQRCKGQLSFLFLFSLFHLLRTALCPSIARLHCLLITFLRLVASLPELSAAGVQAWPSYLVACSSVRSHLWLPPSRRRTGLCFCFSAADRREDGAARGGRQGFEALKCLSGWC